MFLEKEAMARYHLTPKSKSFMNELLGMEHDRKTSPIKLSAVLVLLAILSDLMYGCSVLNLDICMAHRKQWEAMTSIA